MNQQKHYVYIIKAKTKNKFYIGYTVNLERRLRQHNREIKGGAKYTAGFQWEYYAFFSDIDNRILGLKFEWRLKFLIKKKNMLLKIFKVIKWYSTYNKIIFLYINDNILSCTSSAKSIIHTLPTKNFIISNVIIIDNININYIIKYI